MDEFQLSKSLHLSLSATWQETWEDNEVTFNFPGNNASDETDVTFQYDIILAHQISSRVKHALTFTQEPQDTFGSNADTKTTTYGYSLNISEIMFNGLTMIFDATYEESTPLEGLRLTEETTTLTTGLTHTRALSRRLDRVLSYTYTWEDSNFQDGKPKEKHLVIYGLSYRF